jgi:hypothetical protein
LVNPTALIPKNTVEVGLFFEGQPFHTAAHRNPAAAGIDKCFRTEAPFPGQDIQVFFTKKHEARREAATIGTPGTGKFQSLGEK